MKNLIKKALFRSGMLSLYHFITNRHSLTVVLFHRVIPKNDQRWSLADMTWTASDNFFESCIKFFQKYYNIINLDDILKSINKNSKLPPYPLLITFDDGWSDNAEFATKILSKYSIKPIIYVTVSAINKHILSWQEALYSLWKLKLITKELIKNISHSLNFYTNEIDSLLMSESELFKLINLIKKLPKTQYLKISSLIYEFGKKLPVRNQMLNGEQIFILSDETADMGTHGMHHEPMEESSNLKDELYVSKKKLENYFNCKKKVECMSFPHGSCNDKVISEAINFGYKVICGGWQILNSLPLNGSVALLGRINICQKGLCDNTGKLRKELLALYLFRQKSKQVNWNCGSLRII